MMIMKYLKVNIIIYNVDIKKKKSNDITDFDIIHDNLNIKKNYRK